MGAWAQQIVETRRQLVGGVTESSKTTGEIEWAQSRRGSIRQPKNCDVWGATGGLSHPCLARIGDHDIRGGQATSGTSCADLPGFLNDRPHPQKRGSRIVEAVAECKNVSATKTEKCQES
jgi:hypothetical protein